jgi:hypothetical protein
MAETTSKNLTHDSKRKNLSRHNEANLSVVTGTGIPGGLQDTEFEISDETEWSKEFDR